MKAELIPAKKLDHSQLSTKQNRILFEKNFRGCNYLTGCIESNELVVVQIVICFNLIAAQVLGMRINQLYGNH